MVDTSISHLVSEATTARDRFDRRNPTTLYTSIKSCFTPMAMADGISMLDHINGYETYLRQLIQCCRDTSTSTSTSARPAPATGKEVVPYRASTAQELFKDNGLALIAVSRPSAHTSTSSPSSASCSSGPVLATANYSTYEVCIFGTGASFHITADFSHLLHPVRCHVGLTVGGGRVMHATHQRNVEFYIEVSSGVFSVTLVDILYIPD